MKKSFAVIISLGILAQANVFADTKLVRPIPDTQSMIHENNDLPADVFFAAYMSKNNTERRYAEMYLLGVLDTLEGTDFCGYQLYKTITIDEFIYNGFKHLDQAQLNRRASAIIREILSEKSHCKVKGKK